jgi:hypothetical protein
VSFLTSGWQSLLSVVDAGHFEMTERLTSTEAHILVRFPLARRSAAADAFRGLAVRHRTPEESKTIVDQYSYRMPSPLDWMGV